MWQPKAAGKVSSVTRSSPPSPAAGVVPHDARVCTRVHAPHRIPDAEAAAVSLGWVGLLLLPDADAAAVSLGWEVSAASQVQQQLLGVGAG